LAAPSFNPTSSCFAVHRIARNLSANKGMVTAFWSPWTKPTLIAAGATRGLTVRAPALQAARSRLCARPADLDERW
jgi:hypothetical protein